MKISQKTSLVVKLSLLVILSISRVDASMFRGTAIASAATTGHRRRDAQLMYGDPAITAEEPCSYDFQCDDPTCILGFDCPISVCRNGFCSLEVEIETKTNGFVDPSSSGIQCGTKTCDANTEVCCSYSCGTCRKLADSCEQADYLIICDWVPPEGFVDGQEVDNTESSPGQEIPLGEPKEEEESTPEPEEEDLTEGTVVYDEPSGWADIQVAGAAEACVCSERCRVCKQMLGYCVQLMCFG